jgi:integrase/recombinase XerD
MRKFISKFAPAIKEYLEFRVAMGRSTCHEGHLELFDHFCYERYPEVDKLSKAIVLDWIAQESAKERDALGYKASAIRLFAQYVGNGAYILPASFASQKSSFTPYIFKTDELAALFHAADDITPQYGRDPFVCETAPVLFRLIYTCGLRPGEGRLLERKNINLETGEILITQTKGHKERIVVMSDDMLAMCKQYDVRRRITAGNSEYFFVCGNGAKLSTGQFSSLLKRCWIQANPHTPEKFLPRIRPYDLRHQFASAVLHKWLDEGRDMYAMLPYLRAYMGHENFAHTAYYIHLLPEKLLKSPGVDWEKLDAIIPEVGIWED